ncbi:DUF3231 family protein [Neobacillus drentensis]|uniref:DUF3231 family protein n=1 Tax=Neobacillus drentensis TaxID=220684 RepID=UPI002FFDE911
MLNTIQDPQIHNVFQTAYGLCEKHINKLKKLFHQENFPVPKGLNEEDVNLNAPPLFTDDFCLYYIHTMAMHPIQKTGAFLNDMAAY